MIFGGALLAGYLLVASVAFVGLQVTGVEKLGWHDVAWPGRWEKVTQARARYFSNRAGRLLQQGDFPGAELSLLSALQLDPNQFDAALFLAHLRQYQQNYPHSDFIFRRLLEQRPDRAKETALAWQDALLVRQRYAPLVGLALHHFTAQPELSPVWLRSALFAVRLSPDAPELLARLAAEIRVLPAPAQALLTAEELQRRGDSEAALQALWRHRSTPLEPVMIAEFVEQLLRLQQRDRAEVFLRDRAVALAPFDRLFLQMRIDQATNDAALVRMDFERLLRFPLKPAALQLALAWLVEHPDLRSFQRLHELVRRDAEAKLITGSEMWLAAVVCGATAEAAHWAQDCQRRLGLRVPAITAVDFGSDEMTNLAAPPRLIALGRLPHEVVLSLLRRAAVAKSVEPFPVRAR
jgi:hypothetical protein